MRLLKVETCNPNQRAMDFDCNLENIKDSISKAKEAGAIIRLGPKLEENLNDPSKDVALPMMEIIEDLGGSLHGKRSSSSMNCSFLMKFMRLYRRNQWPLDSDDILNLLFLKAFACSLREVIQYNLHMYLCNLNGYARVVINVMWLLKVANFRGSVSRFQEQASGKAEVPSITAPYSLCQSFDLQIPLSIPLKVDGGSNMENLGLQNIHARIRMVLAFMLASLLPRVHNKSGFYLVSGSSNVDEGLRGYMTKIGICTGNYFSRHAAMVILLKAGISSELSLDGLLSIFLEVEAAPPTAPLKPIRSNYSQLDEVDMGMTYEEFSVYGRLRKILGCGPVSSMFKMGHKANSIMQSYSPEDNRFDLRQFLYNARWSSFVMVVRLPSKNPRRGNLPGHLMSGTVWALWLRDQGIQKPHLILRVL
ncbi:hypothetical protein SAY87_000390 [Trapa incisa]|uniref:NAD/GMP synthase domain-containing protein n=1 Tax=Trapa incisa TaxID=236973 RepID=A0AAN7JG61_9MYRT|nr:hypothetical protein SAY87_000390 [Trapa incisa]